MSTNLYAFWNFNSINKVQYRSLTTSKSLIWKPIYSYIVSVLHSGPTPPEDSTYPPLIYWTSQTHTYYFRGIKRRCHFRCRWSSAWCTASRTTSCTASGAAGCTASGAASCTASRAASCTAGGAASCTAGRAASCTAGGAASCTAGRAASCTTCRTACGTTGRAARCTTSRAASCAASCTAGRTAAIWSKAQLSGTIIYCALSFYNSHWEL